MTQGRIIELAREAGAHICTSPVVPDSIPEISFVPQKLERFAALVRAAALEEAAEVCEELDGEALCEEDRLASGHDCAAAIRAMKEQA